MVDAQVRVHVSCERKAVWWKRRQRVRQTRELIRCGLLMCGRNLLLLFVAPMICRLGKWTYSYCVLFLGILQNSLHMFVESQVKLRHLFPTQQWDSPDPKFNL